MSLCNLSEDERSDSISGITLVGIMFNDKTTMKFRLMVFLVFVLEIGHEREFEVQCSTKLHLS